jgi:hypothetical protein
MLLNPKMLELNTRIWINQFGKSTQIKNIPDTFIDELNYKGIEILWLMGVWKTSKSLADKCCFGINLVPDYVKALSDWKKDDVIGSPFAIDDYLLIPALGEEKDLVNFRKKLNQRGIKLFLDFIPNHLGADSSVIKTHPEIFLQTDKESYLKDPYAFFEHKNDKTLYLAHGRDPFFAPWSDTAQLNFFEEATRKFLTKKLEYISSIADGVRCDMAMLPLNNVFQNTWLGVLNKNNYKKPSDEFWKTAIQRIKEKTPNFIFLAEAYWGLEWQLQQLGFDYTYDKTLTDRLSDGDISGIKGHLQAEKEFQIRSMRFIENHDEERAITKFGKFKSMAAAVIISTIQGIRFYYDGQFEGKKTKLPVQLGREPVEKVSEQVQSFYEKLLLITNAQIFKSGKWELLNPEPVSPSNNSFENFLAWQWSLNNEMRVIVVNFSHLPSQCRIKLPDLNTVKNELSLEDLLTKNIYLRTPREIKAPGLFVELKGYQSHISTKQIKLS